MLLTRDVFVRHVRFKENDSHAPATVSYAFEGHRRPGQPIVVGLKMWAYVQEMTGRHHRLTSRENGDVAENHASWRACECMWGGA